eukprot:TRINITY_DN76464_c0_g1_i1.p1 TRINITY_DN76464_c0_g1~~TRINITY_DN76464_c0_g1_i1.p1  ORF type:complete len:402 (+),score=86.19 TRINITY_DN76464_c0_g1_i1:38-1207(+)
MWKTFLSCVLKQLMEKIDKVRMVAGTVLSSLVLDSTVTDDMETDLPSSEVGGTTPKVAHCNAAIPANMPWKQQLHDLLQQPENAHINWSSPTSTFPMLTKLLLPCSALVPSMLSGLVISVGGLTVHVMKPATDALRDCLVTLPKQQTDAETADCSTLEGCTQYLLEMYQNNQQDDRVMIPLINTTDKLITLDCFYGGDQLQYAEKLMQALKSEMNGAPQRDVNKINGVVTVACSVLVLLTHHVQKSDDMQLDATTTTTAAVTMQPHIKQLRDSTLMFLLALLANRYPRVRATVGQQLITTLQTYGEDLLLCTSEQFDDVVQPVIDVLCDTQWDKATAAVVKAQRDLLYPMFGLAKPAPKPKAAAAAAAPKKQQQDGKEGYQQLVADAGF